MKKKNANKKKLTKGKKAAIIAGFVAASEVVAGIGAIIAVPFTGGASAPVAAAMFSDATKNVMIIGGAAVGGTALGVVTTKKIDSKRETKAFNKGYEKASEIYEAKFVDQAKKFAEQKDSWLRETASLEQTKAEKEAILAECMKYINELEKERDSLKCENKTLSIEKQELLEKLHAIQKKLDGGQKVGLQFIKRANRAN